MVGEETNVPMTFIDIQGLKVGICEHKGASDEASCILKVNSRLFKFQTSHCENLVEDASKVLGFLVVPSKNKTCRVLIPVSIQ